MARMLIVDDEQNIREIIREYAEFEGYETAETDDGMKAVRMAKEENYDLIIMDVMMPKLDGYSAVKEIRKFSDVPVIILSARVEEYDKLFGFEIGVDDYVTKPFSPKELMARISAVLKRTRPKKKELIKSDGLEIDIAGRNVFVDGEKKLFHRTRIIFGDPYQPVYTGRRGTSEEMQKIADDILANAYALGGQAVGGKPLCEK